MSQNERRDPRARRRFEDMADAQSDPQGYAPRRRRSQAARLRAETEETYPGYKPPRVSHTDVREGRRDATYKKGYAPDPYDEYEEEPETGSRPPRRKRHVIRWAVVCVLLIALLAGATYVGMERPDLVEPIVQWGRELIFGPEPTPAPTPEPTPTPTPGPTPEIDINLAAVTSFLADQEGETPLGDPVAFQITTTLQTDRIRIVDSDEQTLIECFDTDYVDTADGRLWNVMVYFPEPYDGYVKAYPGNESGWNQGRGSLAAVTVGVDAQETFAGAERDVSQGNPALPVTVTERVYAKNEEAPSFARTTPIYMGDETAYQGENGLSGVLAFRGGNMRQNAAYGSIQMAESRLEPLWTADVGQSMMGKYTWNMQPLIVQWHANMREAMPLFEDKRTKSALKEVLFAAGDGSIHFFDLEDGAATRDPLPMDAPLLSTVSVYPSGVPLVFVGSGDPQDVARNVDTGLIAYNLLGGKYIAKLKGDNDWALSDDLAFITSPLVDVATDTIVAAGGNGLLYTLTLNQVRNAEKLEITVAPTVEAYSGRAGSEDVSIYGALAMMEEYAFFANRGGILQCVNLNSMTSVWAVDLGGRADASVTLEATGGGDAALYIPSYAEGQGVSTLRRLNARTGETLWSVSLPGTVSASPVVGKGRVDGLVFFAATDTPALYALSKESGEVVWQFAMNGLSSASPIAVYDEMGTPYLVQGDGGGLYLLDGMTGTMLDYLTLEGAPIGSPAAFDNTLVVATDTGKLHGIVIK